MNADLVSINDQAENDFIYSQTRSNYDWNDVWLGLTCIGHPEWYPTWVDGSDVTFSNWYKNKPVRDKG